MTKSTLAYTTRGDRNKPPILFLHGLLGAGEEWDSLTTQIEDSYYCIQIDLPGHGNSKNCQPELYAMPACAEAVVGVLDSLQLPVSGLCGYSMGGRLAYYLLTHFADRCHRVLIESASPGLRTRAERTERVTHDEELARRLERDGIGPFLIYWYRQPLFASLAQNHDLLKAVTARRLQNDPQLAARSLRLMGTGTMPDLRPFLEKNTLPLLLVTGDQDSKFTQLAKEIVDLCPAASHRILRDCGHNVHLERPQEFLQLLTSFFA